MHALMITAKAPARQRHMRSTHVIRHDEIDMSDGVLSRNLYLDVLAL